MIHSATEYFNPAVLPSPWTYAHASLVYTTGKRYILRSYAVDSANNAEDFTVIVASSFLYDASTPQISGISSLTNQGYFRRIEPILGAAFDMPASSAAGLAPFIDDGVQIRIQDKQTTQWWSQASNLFNEGDSSNAWFRASAGTPGSWQYSETGELDFHMSTQLASGRSYLLQARAKDTATPPNIGPYDGSSAIFTTGTDSFTIIMDTVPPQSVVEFPPTSLTRKYNAVGITEIYGTVADLLSGVTAMANVDVSIRESVPAGAYWNGAATFTLSSETFYPATALVIGASSTTWRRGTLPAMQNGYTYTVRVRARDAAPGGNLQTVNISQASLCTIRKDRRQRLFLRRVIRQMLSQITGTSSEVFGVAIVR